MPFAGLNLAGLDRVTVRSRGGVSKVELVPAPRWAGTAPSDGSCAWAFIEDRAHYSEETTDDGRLIRHTLSMELPAGRPTARAVERLMALDAGGFVAVLTMASGETLVAGQSERFGTQYPMHIVALKLVSGSSPDERPTVTLFFECFDTELSQAPK
ncbi:MAG: hypothetical protein LBV38_03995 [Alistipes sp.]|jgi:hypothetical protein|nr:hypothetical protein [Alistipes sp.]